MSSAQDGLTSALGSYAALTHVAPMLSNLPDRAVRDVRGWLPWLVALWLSAMLVGWPAKVRAQEAKEKTRLVLEIEASAAANPDASLRPSPIKVRIYELKDAGTFADVDYFSLETADKITLAADMLSKEEFILRPGEKRRIERKSHAQTTAIGVIAGYRDLPNTVWRVTHKLKEAPDASWMRALLPSNRVELSIQLQPHGIVLAEKP